MNKQPFLFRTAFAVFCLIAVSVVGAQESPSPRLIQGDVGKFIDTWPGLSTELAALDMEYAEGDDIGSYFAAASFNAEAMAIFAKYGWDEDYYPKASVIMMTSVMLEGARQMKSDSETAGMAGMFEAQLTQSVHPNDIDLVRPRVPEIVALLEETD